MNSKIITTTLALAAEIEREFISTRTKEALAELKKNGVKLGRPVGSKSIKKKLQENHNEVVGYLDKKIQKRRLPRFLTWAGGTLDNYINSQIL